MTRNEILCMLYGLVLGLTGRRFILKLLIARIMAWINGDAVKKIVACIPQIVAEAEKAMQDGVVTADERKAFAMRCIDIVSEQFGYKLTGIMRWVVSVIIDNVAQKLPSKDVKIPDIILSIRKEF